MYKEHPELPALAAEMELINDRSLENTCTVIEAMLEGRTSAEIAVDDALMDF